MTAEAGPRRRSNATDPVAGLNYAGIGATAGAEVLAFPPTGFTVTEHHHRVGSGEDRFDRAARDLMTWAVLRRARAEISEVQAEAGGADGRGPEPRFLEDGTPWVTPGMTAVVVWPGRRAPLGGRLRVVSVVDEPGRMGFTTGTCIGNTAEREQLLLLERDADGSVWLTVRTMTRRSRRRLSPATVLGRRQWREIDRRVLTALHPANARA